MVRKLFIKVLGGYTEESFNQQSMSSFEAGFKSGVEATTCPYCGNVSPPTYSYVAGSNKKIEFLCAYCFDGHRAGERLMHERSA